MTREGGMRTWKVEDGFLPLPRTLTFLVLSATPCALSLYRLPALLPLVLLLHNLKQIGVVLHFVTLFLQKVVTLTSVLPRHLLCFDKKLSACFKVSQT